MTNNFFVDGLHHNMINVIQLYDNQMIVEFTRIGCNILNEEMRKMLLVGKRVKKSILLTLRRLETLKCAW